MPAPAGVEAKPLPAREPARPRRRRNPMRAFIALLALLILGGAVAAGVVAVQGGDEPVRTRQITGDDVGEVVTDILRLIDENVR